MVLKPGEVKISKSMRKVLRDNPWKITFNTAFEEVMIACKRISRKGQQGTWITDEMLQAYQELHVLGYAESVEIWEENRLIGGLYGINLKEKKVFCGESMFSKKSNASKTAFIKLAQRLKQQDYKLIDCQVYNDHLASLGAYEINRDHFLNILNG